MLRGLGYPTSASRRYSLLGDCATGSSLVVTNPLFIGDQLGVEEIRSILRNTTRMLIARARHNSELVGKLWTAIDVTNGFEFTGDLNGYEHELTLPTEIAVGTQQLTIYLFASTTTYLHSHLSIRLLASTIT